MCRSPWVAGCVNALLLTDVTYVIIAPSAESDPLMTCISYFISYCFIIYCSRFVFASGLMNKCPLKGHSVLQSIPGSVASCVVGRSVLFPDMPADIRIWVNITARGGLSGNLSKCTFHQEANYENHNISSAVWLCFSYRVCGFIYTYPTPFSRALSPPESR